MVDQLIRMSMDNNKPLVIIYQSPKGITQRSVQVKSIEDDIIRAFCYTKGEFRLFKIDNILSATIDYRAGIHQVTYIPKQIH